MRNVPADVLLVHEVGRDALDLVEVDVRLAHGVQRGEEQRQLEQVGARYRVPAPPPSPAIRGEGGGKGALSRQRHHPRVRTHTRLKRPR